MRGSAQVVALICLVACGDRGVVEVENEIENENENESANEEQREKPTIGHGDPLLGIPDGAEEFVTGPRMRGTVVNGADVRPLEGFTLIEHGVPSPAPAQVTGEDGVFLVELTDEATPAFGVTREGWVPTIMLTTDQGRLYFKGEFKIEMFERADEEAAYLEETGAARDWSQGRVVLNFQPMGSAAHVKGALQAPGVKPFRYDAEDNLLPGDTFGDDPLIGEIVFPDVPPGEWPVVITEPEGLDCRGPETAPVEAGTYTRVYYFCRPDTLWESDPGGQQDAP